MASAQVPLRLSKRQSTPTSVPSQDYTTNPNDHSNYNIESNLYLTAYLQMKTRFIS